MVEGPFGVVLDEDPGIVIYFNNDVSSDDIENIRRSILESEMPLIAYKYDKRIRDKAIKLKMGGEAITLDTMKEIKGVTESVTSNSVRTVEVRTG